MNKTSKTTTIAAAENKATTTTPKTVVPSRLDVQARADGTVKIAPKKTEWKGVKHIMAGETIISAYKGTSVRQFAEAWRAEGRKLPKLYLVCQSMPIRNNNGTKVIVEGRYTVGAIVNGQPILLSRIIGAMGFKIPLTGAKDRVLETISDLKAALNQTGKYARRKSAAGNVETK